MQEQRDLSGVHVGLFEWWLKNRRGFPWREDLDDYRALMSEILLWKTTAKSVAAVWEHFFSDFPTVQTLASVHEGDVDHVIRPLGLRKRSELLIRAAGAICSRHGGIVPTAKRDLVVLPGVGEYVASAFLCFHLEQDEPIVDANVRRVVTRIVGCRSEDVPAFARAMLPVGWAPEWNYALLDLGAIVCSTKPQCQACPMSRVCVLSAGG